MSFPRLLFFSWWKAVILIIYFIFIALKARRVLGQVEYLTPPTHRSPLGLRFTVSLSKGVLPGIQRLLYTVDRFFPDNQQLLRSGYRQHGGAIPQSVRLVAQDFLVSGGEIPTSQPRFSSQD